MFSPLPLVRISCLHIVLLSHHFVLCFGVSIIFTRYQACLTFTPVFDFASSLPGDCCLWLHSKRKPWSFGSGRRASPCPGAPRQTREPWMESSGGERWAERLRALQLPHNHAYGDRASYHIPALLLGGKKGKRGETAACTVSACTVRQGFYQYCL